MAKLGKRKHLLVTKEIERALKKAPIGSTDGKAAESPVIVKFFSPYSNWTWYVTEGEWLEQFNDWRFFGLVVGFEKELGYFMLSELENATVKVFGTEVPAVERDCYFGKHNLGEFL